MLFDSFSRFLRSKAITFLFILLGLTLTSQHLANAAPQSDQIDTRGRIIVRDDYPSDYPYPKKDDLLAAVTTARDKSLFYTGLRGFGLKDKQLQDYKKEKSLHILNDGITYQPHFLVNIPWSVLESLGLDQILAGSRSWLSAACINVQMKYH